MKLSVKCRAGLQPRGTSWRGRNGLTGTSWRAVKGNPVSCHWEGITIGYNQYSLRANQQKSNSAEKDLGVLMENQEPAVCWKPTTYQAAGGRPVPTSCVRGSFPSGLVRYIWSSGSRSGFSSAREKRTPWRYFSEYPSRRSTQWSTQCMKKLWGKGGLVGLEEKGSEISLQTSTSKRRGIEKPEPGGSGSYKAKGQGTPELSRSKQNLDFV